MNPTMKNHKEKIIGYKAVKKDNKGYYTDGLGNAEKMYFQLNKTYSVKGSPELCKNGIHFFRNYCFALDYLEKGNVILKIESLGEVQEDTYKCVTNKCKIVAVEYVKEVDGNRNSGDRNSGYCNSGNYNSGHRNSGYYNSGNYNSGYCNSGNYNSGYYNSGNRNSGDCNSGYNSSPKNL